MQVSAIRVAVQKFRPIKPLTCGMTQLFTRPWRRTAAHSRFLASRRPWFTCPCHRVFKFLVDLAIRLGPKTSGRHSLGTICLQTARGEPSRQNTNFFEDPWRTPRAVNNEQSSSSWQSHTWQQKPSLVPRGPLGPCPANSDSIQKAPTSSHRD